MPKLAWDTVSGVNIYQHSEKVPNKMGLNTYRIWYTISGSSTHYASAERARAAARRKASKRK